MRISHHSLLSNVDVDANQYSVGRRRGRSRRAISSTCSYATDRLYNSVCFVSVRLPRKDLLSDTKVPYFFLFLPQLFLYQAYDLFSYLATVKNKLVKFACVCVKYPSGLGALK